MVDATDNTIIELLIENSRQSSRELAGKIGLDSSTVRRRVDKLVKNHVLEFSAQPNPDLLGYPVRAFIVLNVMPSNLSQVIRELSKIPDVRWISPVSGRFDILTYVWFRSNQEILNFHENTVGKLQGVTHVETFVCLTTAENARAR